MVFVAATVGGGVRVVAVCWGTVRGSMMTGTATATASMTVSGNQRVNIVIRGVVKTFLLSQHSRHRYHISNAAI